MTYSDSSNKIKCTITNYDIKSKKNSPTDVKIVIYDNNKMELSKGYSNYATASSIFDAVYEISRLDGNIDDLSIKDLEIACKKYGNDNENMNYSFSKISDVKIDQQSGTAFAVIDNQSVTFSFEPVRKGVSELSVTDHCLKIVKDNETFRANSYKCPAGVWTIGYGHTEGVKPRQKVTLEEAERLLQKDIETVAIVVKKYVKVPLSQNEFDALVSFVFNVGEGSFRKSTMLEKLNSGDYKSAAEEFPKWNKGGGSVLKGLISRRKEEKNLFMNKIA